MLWKRKISIFVVWFVVIGAALLIIRKLPLIYKAEATILVDSQKIPERYVSSTVSTELQDRIATISQQILSSTRLKKIIDDFDLYHKERTNHFEEEILEMMRKDISVRLERGWAQDRPGAFRIGYEGMNAATVAQVANRIANLFIEENLKTREVQAEGTSEFMDSQLKEAQRRLDELESAVSNYKLKHNGELPQQEEALSGALSRLQVALEANRDAINRAQDSKVVLENTLSTVESAASMLAQRRAEAKLAAQAQPVASGAPGTVTSGPVSSGSVPRKASDTLELQLDALRSRYSDDHPDVKRLRQEIARVKALEEKQQAETASQAAPSKDTTPEKAAATPPPASPVTPPVAPPHESVEVIQARERIAALKSQLKLLDKEVESRKTEQQQILHEIASYQQRLNNLPVREQEMLKVTRDYDIARVNYRSLLDKKLAAEMATDMERRQKSERFTLLDPARTPEKPFKPNRDRLNLLGAAAGLALGLAAGLARELQKDVLLGEWELPPDAVVLGRVPSIAIAGTLEPDAHSGRRSEFLKRKWRLALFSSGLASLLAALVAGFYLVTHRF